jgi:hypothetical protein
MKELSSLSSLCFTFGSKKPEAKKENALIARRVPVEANARLARERQLRLTKIEVSFKTIQR